MQARISTSGLDQIQSALQELGESKLQDFSPLASQIKDVFREDLRERFFSSPPVEMGGTVYGGAYWQPLIKPRRSGQILIDSRDLERSLTVEGDANNIFEIDGTEIIFGSNLPYAARQNDGYQDPLGSANTPARPFLFWHPVLLNKIQTLVNEWLVADFGQ